MPIELKKYFWDTEFNKLDKEKNKRYIISRLYCYGDLKEIKWIKENYSKEDMAYYVWTSSMNYEYWRVRK